MNHSALEFFKIVEEMIDSGSTCSEILKKINEQPFKIGSLIGDIEKRTLKRGGDKVLKELMNEGRTGGGIGADALGEAIRTAIPGKLNDFDRFEIFIKDTIKNQKKKNLGKKIK
jgi:hypothetical protein